MITLFVFQCCLCLCPHMLVCHYVQYMSKNVGEFRRMVLVMVLCIRKFLMLATTDFILFLVNLRDMRAYGL